MKLMVRELFRPDNLTVRLEVVPIPKSGLVTVKEGEPATIACKITRGGPKTYITWKTSVRLKLIRTVLIFFW